MKTLQVFYCGWGEDWLVGTLADNGEQLLFEFSAEALKQGLEFSPLKMPLQKKTFSDLPDYQMRLPGFIADSLPDGWGLLLMDKLFRRRSLDLKTISPLDRLAFIGDRGMGALRFEPSTEDASQTRSTTSLLQLAEEAWQIYSNKNVSSATLKEMALLGGSPHGARPKVLLNNEGIPWLYKFPAASEHKEVCAIEAFYSDLANACGIEMPSTKYIDLDKKMAAFGVERFDRRNGLKIHTHTLASALHADFRVPSAVDAANFLRMTRKITCDEREVLKAFERCVFNIVFNNRDDHAKNFSYLLNQKREWKLAPAYDLTYSEGPRGEHQMDICGEGKNPARAHLQQLCQETNLDQKSAFIIVDKILECSLQMPELAKNFAIRKTTFNKILASTEKNRKLLL